MKKRMFNLFAVILIVVLFQLKFVFPQQKQDHSHSNTDRKQYEQREERYRSRMYWQMPKRVLNELGVEPGQIIGDVGCGIGYFSLQLAKKVGESGKVFASDIDKGALQYLEERFKEQSIQNIQIIHGEENDPLLPKENIDLVLIVNTIQFVDDPSIFLNNIKPCLKSNGRVAIIQWDADKMDSELPGWSSDDRKKYTKQTILRTIYDADYEIIQMLDFLPMQTIYICQPRAKKSKQAYPLSKIKEHLEIVRLSDRVIVLTGLLLPAGGYITAINTEEGIVVIDTGASLGAAELCREMIQNEFPEKDFAYVIHTHGHGDHIGANQVFPETKVVAHLNTLKYFSDYSKPNLFDDMIPMLNNQIKTLRQRIEGMEKDSEEWKITEMRLALDEQMLFDADKGYHIRFPSLTFNKEMSLSMGDLTFRMYAFLNYHSDSDILIHIPEEGVLLMGDTLSRSALPGTNTVAASVDVPGWIKVLDRVMEDGQGVKHAVRGHSYVMNNEEVKARRDYIKQIWEAVKNKNTQGQTPEDIIPQLSLEDFGYITKLYKRTPEQLKSQHEQIITGFWRQLQGRRFATQILARTYRESGWETAIKEFKNMINDKEKFFFNEGIVNSYASMLVEEGDIKNALELYQLNAVVFPESAAIYAGMGDAFQIDGNMDAAVKAYKKALELDPNDKRIAEKLNKIR